MDSAGQISSTTGYAGCTGSRTVGQFTISGTAGVPITLSTVRSPATYNMIFYPTLQMTHGVFDTNGELVVKVWGDLELNNAIAGDVNIEYTITANYQ